MSSELSKRIALAALTTDADQPSSEVAIDAELQEVREVLEGISDDDCYNACWQRWGKERGDDQFHSEDCQRARALMERLKIQ